MGRIYTYLYMCALYHTYCTRVHLHTFILVRTYGPPALRSCVRIFGIVATCAEVRIYILASSTNGGTGVHVLDVHHMCGFTRARATHTHALMVHALGVVAYALTVSLLRVLKCEHTYSQVLPTVVLVYMYLTSTICVDAHARVPRTRTHLWHTHLAWLRTHLRYHCYVCRSAHTLISFTNNVTQ